MKLSQKKLSFILLAAIYLLLFFWIEQRPSFGQKDTVNKWTLVAQNTIEEKIADILSEKQKILDAVLDGKKSDRENLLTELIKKMKGETNESKRVR